MKKIMNTISIVLDKVKWFGLRKIYYFFKNFNNRKKLNSKLINKDISRFLIKTFDGYMSQNTNEENGDLGLGLLHYSFIINNKPKNILVVGSKKGFIPAVIAKACRDINHGHVDFVDAAYGNEDGDEKSWLGTGFWKKSNPKKHFAQLMGIEKYIDTHVMTSAEFAKKNKTKKYQYIYIDGDHSYSGVKKDYALFFPKLEKNGLILFHDILGMGDTKINNFGVHKFWKEIKKDKVNIMYPENVGLGILQKK